MKLDILKTEGVSRSQNQTVQYQLKRGRLSGLLLVSGLTWHYKDFLTVKLRHEGGLVTVVDRVSCFLLAQLCDMKQGRPTTGTPNENQDINGDETAALITTNPGQLAVINAFYLPLGHITLAGTAELEINIDTAFQAPIAPATTFQTGTIKIIAVQDAVRADTILTYDRFNDLEATQHNVREMFLVGKNGQSFFNDGGASTIPVPKDVLVRLDANGETNTVDVECLGAMTAITGELSTSPNALIRAYSENGALPSSVTYRVTGADAGHASLLFVREVNIPHMTSASIVSAMSIEQKKVEQLEQNDPERAKSLMQTGQIRSSETIQAAKESVRTLSAPTLV